MTDENTTPLADDELDEVAGGKILNRANSASDNDDGDLGTEFTAPELPGDTDSSGGGTPGTFGGDVI
jgi:hypothetical protein